MVKIGLALGSGGARGIAHLTILEILNEMGVVPHQVAGTSVGAIVGALYCSGVDTRETRELLNRYSVNNDDTLRSLVKSGTVRKWLDVFTPQFRGPGLVRIEKFLADLFSEIDATTFDELSIPLKVVAADMWNHQQVVFDSGALIPAVRASMSLPGLLEPIKLNDRMLIDGGAVNPVPFDLLEDCDFTIAVNVLGHRTGKNGKTSMSDVVFSTFQIMQKSILHEKQKISAPSLLITPHLQNIRVLEFYRANQILRLMDNQRDQFKREIAEALAKVL